MARMKIESVRKIVGCKIAANVVGYARPWILNHRFPSRDCPELYATLEKIRNAGVIDSDRWHLAKSSREY